MDAAKKYRLGMRADTSTTEGLGDNRRKRARRAAIRERVRFARPAAWGRRADARLEEPFVAIADATGSSASKKPRQSHRIGSDARRILIVLILLLARAVQPTAD